MTAKAARSRVRGPLAELTIVRVRELVREPEAVFWVFVFPILLAAVLGIAFRSRPPEKLPIGVAAGPHAEARAAVLSAAPELRASVLSEDEARQAVSRGRVVLVVTADDPPSYLYDPTQPEGRTARLAVDTALQRAAGRSDAFTPGVTSTIASLPVMASMRASSSGTLALKAVVRSRNASSDARSAASRSRSCAAAACAL